VYDTCPKCGHRGAPANVRGAESCAACGLVYAKWTERQARASSAPAQVPADAAAPAVRRWRDYLLYVPERPDPLRFWGHAALYAVFFVWGWYFILLDFRGNEIGESFMHRVNLVFHEAGHVIFMPLGNFMMMLGGSLGQLLVPAIVMAALLVSNRDAFGASLGLWWLGQSLMDLAPYVNDARALELMLLGGGTGRDRPGIHDWENILLDLRLIEYDRQIAWLVDAAGTLLVLAALSWGACVLVLEYRNLARPE